MFTLNGRPIRPENFADEMMKSMTAQAIQHLRDEIGSIRDPETGEFPIVHILGNSLEDLQVQVEGSEAVVALVQERLAAEEGAPALIESVDGSGPCVFLSYGSEDRELARRLAEGLQAAGIHTWLDAWDIGPGESIRQKIEEGIERCTHFVALLTPTSITKPWVNQEIDGAFMEKIAGRCRFFPVRYQLSAEALPPMLRSMYSRAIADAESGLKQLIEDVRGVNDRPPPAPPDEPKRPRTGYSKAATDIARLIVEESHQGLFMDPQSDIKTLAQRLDLSEESVRDALHEMRHFLRLDWDRVWPEDSFFAEFDGYWKPWKPADDALRLAADMVNIPDFPTAPRDIAARYGWDVRRINPAITYLRVRDLVKVFEGIAAGGYVVHGLWATDDTRRFVKSRT